MTKTQNYQLNQWDAADPIRREDFNADNAAVDAALGKVKERVLLREETHAVTGVYYFDVDVTGLMQEDYWAIEIYPEMVGPGPSYIYMNDDQTFGHYKEYNSNHTYVDGYNFGEVNPLPGKSCLTLFPGTTAICGFVERADTMWQKDPYYMPTTSGVTPETLTFIRFRIYQGPYTSDAKIKICGVRR